jgi:hypothetical protein
VRNLGLFLLVVEGLFVNSWDIGSSKVSPSNHEPSIVAFTSVCDGIVDVSTKLGTLPKIGGKFLKHLEW